VGQPTGLMTVGVAEAPATPAQAVQRSYTCFVRGSVGRDVQMMLGTRPSAGGHSSHVIMRFPASG
jgi:hypothetical protein